MRKLILWLPLSLFATFILAQEEQSMREVYTLETPQNQISLFEGALDQGQTMPLRWAENSSVACFPGTRFVEFQGNHVLYRMQMPAYSDLKITVQPKDPKHRINIYALRLGVNNMDTPPNISRAISCEAGYPIYAGQPNLNAPAEAQSVSYISVARPYSILIGVAGAKGVLEGAYELKVELKER
ncbi:MAG: hypothetical protein F6K19_24405 [Cyanothece sp. SIO1E1]|nr:hypothetical protein [Cyanothece sp. SIO1E1]